MSGPQVRVEGAGTLRRTLRAATGNLDDLKDANARVSAMVAQWAAVTAPRRTGQLGGSVRGTRQAARAVINAGSASVPYAGVINYGWPARNIAAQPWMSQAAVNTQPSWLPIYQADVQKILDTVRGT